MLAERFNCSKNERGFIENKSEKNCIEKSLVFEKKTKFGIACWTEKFFFKTILHFEKSHNVENCKTV